MRIKRLDIGRFGCFTEERLEDLNPGLNVLAGPQRAGKTTFMKLLRHLGYRYPDDGFLMHPPGGEDGRVDAHVLHEEHTYTIHHRGGSPPSVTTENEAPPRAASDLYGGLLPYRYHQVFTVGLDELRGDPAGDDGEDGNDVRTALLGSGWSEVVRMPGIVQEFSREAELVGGKRGDGLRELRPFIETIEDGDRRRREAVSQRGDYRALRERLAEAENAVEEARDGLETKRRDRERLRVVRNLYDHYETYRSLRSSLEGDENRELLENYPPGGQRRAKRLHERYVKVRERFQAALEEWNEKTDNQAGRGYRRRLLEHQEVLEQHRLTLAGLKQEVAGFLERREEFREEFRAFQQDAAEISEDYVETPKKLELLRTDPGSHDKVQRASRQYLRAQRRYEELQDRLSGIGYELDELKARTDTIDRSDLIIWGGQVGGSLFFVVLAAVLALTATTDVVLWGSLAVGLAAAGFGVYSAMKAWDAWQITSAQSGLTPKVRRLRNERNELQKKKDRLKEERDEARQRLEAVREELNLPDFDPEYLRETYGELEHLKRRWMHLQPRREKLEQQEKRLQENLTELINLARELKLTSSREEDPLEEADRILGPLQDAVGHLELARKLHDVARRGDETAAEIVELLQRERPELNEAALLENDERLEEELLAFRERGERFQELKETDDELRSARQYLTGSLENPAVRELFEPFPEASDDEAEILEAYGACWSKFTSRDDVKEGLEDLDAEIERRRDQLEEARRKQREIEGELRALAPEDLLEEARLKIQDGRRGLLDTADRYARLRLAEAIVERLHSRLVTSLHGPLLEQASDAFERITGGDYAGVELAEVSGRVAFRARLPGGGTRPVSRLSRGTREQFFLAVRLARVRTIDPPLPVIIDDSAVNFDPLHLERLTHVLEELSDTHQLFLLTSHPELVAHLRDLGTGADFWTIRSDHSVTGHGSDAAELLELLETGETSA